VGSRGRPGEPDVTIIGPGFSWGGKLRQRGGGERVRFDDEMSSCSFSSAVVSALGKRSYGWITRSVEGAASAAGGRGGGAGRRVQRDDATAGDSDSALLPATGRGAWRGTPTPAQAPTPPATGHEPLESVPELSRVRVG
jgi:hypothetical protein